MRIVRFQKGKRRAYGVWEDDLIREISGSIFGEFTSGPKTHRIGEVRLLAPVEPTKILCVGLNFRDHIEEVGMPTPKYPAHFLKPLTTMAGPDDPIVIPRVAEQVDYEGELAVVIRDRIKIHYLSQCMTLLPGDIISTGTPRGVAAMKPGDVVEVSIDGIGVLRNPVRAT